MKHSSWNVLRLCASTRGLAVRSTTGTEETSTFLFSGCLFFKKKSFLNWWFSHETYFSLEVRYQKVLLRARFDANKVNYTKISVFGLNFVMNQNHLFANFKCFFFPNGHLLQRQAWMNSIIVFVFLASMRCLAKKLNLFSSFVAFVKFSLRPFNFEYE